MKRTIFTIPTYILIGIITILTSCQNDEPCIPENPADNNNIESRSSETPSIEHIPMQSLAVLYANISESNDVYTLNLSRDEALKYGVTYQLYDRFTHELDEANKFIDQSKAEGSEIEKTDYQAAAKKMADPLYRLSISSASTLGETIKPTYTAGHIETIGQEEGYDYCYVPSRFSHIKFQCLARAALVPGFVCKTYSFGSWTSKTGIGFMGIIRTIEVTPAATMTDIKVAFSTTDSNGGICNWNAEGIE